MKTTKLILAAVLFIGFTACGQSVKDVPGSIKSSFTKRFPNATNVKWGKENENEWEAEFKIDGKNYSANFNNTGEWVETEYQVKANELPPVVKATLANESKGARIKVSEVSETKEGKFFEFVYSDGEDETELIIDNAGNVVKKEQVDEENENDEKEEK